MLLRACKRRFLLFIFGAGIIATAASAQSTLGSINGVVRDPTDADMSGIKIIFHRNESNTERAVSSDANDSYSALNVTSPAFGTITQACGFDFGGNCTGQVSVKLEF